MKIGIATDTHISPYGDWIDKHTGLNRRMVESAQTWQGVCEDMQAQGVQLCIFGGDISKNARPTPTVLGMFSVFRPMPFHAIHGNHDAKVSNEKTAVYPFTWLNGVTYRANMGVDTYIACEGCPAERTILGSHELTSPFDGYVQVISIPYPNRNALLAHEDFKKLTAEEANRTMHDLVAAELSRLAGQLRDDIPSILIAHLALDLAKVGTEGYMAGRDVCLGVADIPDNIDYCLFGHIHRAQDILRVNRDGTKAGDYLYVVGSTDRTSFNEEGEDKRWILLDTEAHTVEPRPTGAKEFKTVQIDLTSDGEHGFQINPDSYVRVIAKVREKQVADSYFREAEKIIRDLGATPVQFITEREGETRLDLSEVGEGETYEDLLGAYCDSKGIGGDRKSTLVSAGIEAIKGVQS